MQAVTLSIGDRQFRLRMTTDLAEFSDRIVAAVRSGGGMVDIPVAGAVGVQVLVSPGMNILLETHEVDPDVFLQPTSTAPWLAADDIDY